MQPPPIEVSQAEPVVYTGRAEVDRRFTHGGIRPAVGVHQIQAVRANRSEPLPGDEVGWTYNHQPYLAYWRGRFYLQYLSNRVTEHLPPGRTLLARSADGVEWDDPQAVFPVLALPEIHHPLGDLPAGTAAQCHQRMGFYVSSDDRLLTLAFYSWAPHSHLGPNLGQGLGRFVREVYEDGGVGELYVIRPNRYAGWTTDNLPFPVYTDADDAGFVAACDELLADKLVTLQWWEEERANDDGFFAFQPDEPLKALSYYHRPDGVVVGLWKKQFAALSPDDGKTWTPVATTPTIQECLAKTWGQATSDGRYALVYNHSATRRNRFPMVVVTGEDGHAFDDMLCVDGELSPMRYAGLHKNLGTQYVRGIVEGNGTPPGGAMWLTYSMNKEDIWVTSVPAPVRGTVTEHVDEPFDVARATDLDRWNLHIPRWAPITVVDDPHAAGNRCLRLADEDPYEYALAERVFPDSERVWVGFRVCVQATGDGPLETEVQDEHGRRPIVLRWDAESLSFDVGPVETEPITIEPDRWYDVELDIDCAAGRYDAHVDGELVRADIALGAPVEAVCRLVFRTGSWRSDVRALIVDGEPKQSGVYVEDRPGADVRRPASAYLVDDVRTRAA